MSLHLSQDFSLCGVYFSKTQLHTVHCWGHWYIDSIWELGGKKKTLNITGLKFVSSRPHPMYVVTNKVLDTSVLDDRLARFLSAKLKMQMRPK